MNDVRQAYSKMRQRIEGMWEKLLRKSHARGAARFLISRISGRRVLVHGTWKAQCAICMQNVEPASMSCRCECGAVYHIGCSMFRGSCSCCGEPLVVEHGLTYVKWLPKVPVFSEGAEESLLAGFRCPSCDCAVSAEDSHCPGCGFHLSTMNGFKCQLCGCEVRDGDAFCRYCGSIYSDAGLKLYQCPFCYLVNAEGMTCSCGSEAWGRPFPPSADGTVALKIPAS